MIQAFFIRSIRVIVASIRPRSIRLQCRVLIQQLLVLLLLAGGSSAHAEVFDHADWDGLLSRHVIEINEGHATEVDYTGMAREHASLKSYLEKLEQVKQVRFDGWSKDEQLAFLINAYNAWTVELILSKYPDLESIKDLGSIFRSPWKKRFIPLLGEERSLDDIEHTLIRGSGRYQDPRIHFAVNCASIGCPALGNQAYEGGRLQAQLELAANRFLGDRSRNYFSEGTLHVSSIFKWYRGDFEKGWRGYQSLGDFLAGYGKALSLDATTVSSLRDNRTELEFLDYDWALNKKR